jgi:hypothetical protein
MESRITQDNHTFFKLPNQPLKGVIRDMGGGTLPCDDQAILVQHQTQCATYHLKNSRLKVPALPGCHNEGK